MNVASGPAVSLSPAALTFATQLVGTVSAKQAVTLTNTGGSTLTITSITFTGTNLSDFLQTNTCGTSVAPGASCTINVSFSPKFKNARSALLTISDNAPNSPQTIAVSGTGTFVKLVPTSLNFGNQKVGTSSQPKNITLTNVSTTTTVSITSITLTGANASDYSQTNTCGTSVAPLASCTISVTFTPTKTGLRSGFVNVNDDGGGSPQKVKVTGTGT